jgi:hypothetical protein
LASQTPRIAQYGLKVGYSAWITLKVYSLVKSNTVLAPSSQLGLNFFASRWN